jgi:hypothetical protein
MKYTIQGSIVALATLTLWGLSPNSVFAVDHNNIDANRPLSFDDAESIAYREQSIEFGAALLLPEGRSVGGAFDIEYLYGFAPNTHLNIGIDPSIGGRSDTDNTEFDIGDLSVGVLHNFNREYNNTPAFAVRADAALPTGKDSEGVKFRVRGIASKTIGQYDRLHLNLDLNVNTETEENDRSITPGAILGYSRPIGYPRRFDQTVLAELGIRADEEEDGGAIVSVGVGLRKQVGYQSVLDIGLQGNLATDSDARSEVRFITGYSLAF